MEEIFIRMKVSKETEAWTAKMVASKRLRRFKRIRRLKKWMRPCLIARASLSRAEMNRRSPTTVPTFVQQGQRHSFRSFFGGCGLLFCQ